MDDSPPLNLYERFGSLNHLAVFRDRSRPRPHLSDPCVVQQRSETFGTNTHSTASSRIIRALPTMLS